MVTICFSSHPSSSDQCLRTRTLTFRSPRLQQDINRGLFDKVCPCPHRIWSCKLTRVFSQQSKIEVPKTLLAASRKKIDDILLHYTNSIQVDLWPLSNYYTQQLICMYTKSELVLFDAVLWFLIDFSLQEEPDVSVESELGMCLQTTSTEPIIISPYATLICSFVNIEYFVFNYKLFRCIFEASMGQ